MVQSLLLAGLALIANLHGAPAQSHSISVSCPSADLEPLTIIQGGDFNVDSVTVTIDSKTVSGNLCILSLLALDSEQHVARSYDGRDWEISAGPFSEFIDEPSCDGQGVCTMNIPTDNKTLGDLRENKYILTTYSHTTSREAKVARFLEQATFGPTQEGINSLSETAVNEDPDFASWIEHQLDSSPDGVGMSAHREFFRSHATQRYEYPFVGGGAGPKSACEITSRWRKFALTERDGSYYKAYAAKYLSIKRINRRYVWFVEGMARTTTSSLGDISNVDGKYIRKLDVEPIVYRITAGAKYFNDLMKYSCIGCPVHICGSFGCGYIENPKVDLTGIEGTSHVPYKIVKLPNIMENNNEMVSIDDGPYIKVLEQWQKPHDEFYLNTSIDLNQCKDHPPTHLPIASKFDGVKDDEHVKTASPPIFGSTINAITGEEEMMLFDPTFQFQENTVENPASDGGGTLRKDTDGVIFCSNVPRSFQNEDSCKLSFHPLACSNKDGVKVGDGKGIVVCGSPGEVASNHENGVMESFDLKRGEGSSLTRKIYKDGVYTQQKYNIWYHLALNADDQLRQRMAWALYQIVPIGTTGGFSPMTEIWMIYYDIFVRNAFGSYRNILKEISFNHLMSEWLTFYGNAAIQYSIDYKDSLNYPDENYAREVMQLFSIGIQQLNMDGTKKLDENGEAILTYESSDIVSYARAWTGLEKEDRRGNVENGKKSSTGAWRVDPLRINRQKHDVFPKSDLFGGFIGDGYPLCSDLPDKDFLRKGAIYRLLGSKSSPELLEDESEWEEFGIRLGLQQSSPLYEKLCASGADGKCTFPAKVVLNENLIYDDAAKTGAEYEVDTIRSIRVQASPVPIFYEYSRPPCVHQNFFNNGKKIIAGEIRSDLVVKDSMCADPRTYIAAESCCAHGDERGIRFCSYNGERMRYDFAVNRCSENQHTQCNPKRWESDVCMDFVTYSWSTSECAVKVKIPFDLESHVARVDHPGPDYAGNAKVNNYVQDDTVNFFKVPWNGNTKLIPNDASSCDAISSCYSVTDGCVCTTNVVESAAFTSTDEIGSAQDIKNLKIGAFPPSMFDSGYYRSLGNCGLEGVEIFSSTSSDCHNLHIDTIFVITDGYGVKRYLKNLLSRVEINAINDLSFRNPVHFIDFADRSLRDMHYEIDAVLDSYFYHPTHAPFLTMRILQRFGVSNPSPNYIKRVATAYTNGSYLGRFGSGKYGDLGALIAAALLDPESRSVTLDADPSHGHIREPVIKITSFLRSLSTKYFAPLTVPLVNGPSQISLIGQGPYRVLSVFSFFLPEFMPAGQLGDAGLVAPEAEVIDSRVLTLMNGFYATVKFGLSMCYGGFGHQNLGAACPRREGIITEDALGMLTYSASSGKTVDEVLDELSLLMTSSRLGSSNRGIIKHAIEEVYATDKPKAIRIAQQLIASTPEFHTTNLPQTTDEPRSVSSYMSKPRHSYRAVVYFLMRGGADSFNLLVPKDNCHGKDMFAEYLKARGKVALSQEDLLGIDASQSDQICDTFGVYDKFPLLQSLYNEKQAIFFANTGILAKPTTKHDNWKKQGKVQLFAHNHMQRGNCEVDPFQEIAGTGVGGRILDILKREGFQTSANRVSGNSVFAKGFSSDNSPIWNVNSESLSEFDEYSTIGGNMLDLIKQLNGEGKEGNSLYGETFSSRISQTIFERESNIKINELLDDEEYSMDEYPSRGSSVNQDLRSVATYMKMRNVRNVDRDVFIVSQDGYDMHSENILGSLFGQANDALHNFIDELKRQGIWEDTTIVMGSDFGRSITANSNGGTDHAWGGNYFIIGGAVNGGKILGKYPHDLSEKSSQWIMRGRMIPTTGWDSIWNGIAGWMGVRGDDNLNELLPNRKNFDKCDLFTDKDLFIDGKLDKSSCTIADGDGDGVSDQDDRCPETDYWNLDIVNSVGCLDGNTHAPTPANEPSTITPTTTIPTIEKTSTPTSAPYVAIPTSSPTPLNVVEPTPVHNILSSFTSIVRLGGTATGGDDLAVDGTTDKYVVIKDGSASPGLQITPSWKSVVTGIRVYTADDGRSRDPSKFVLEGTNTLGENWNIISQGSLSLPEGRNPQQIRIHSSVSQGDTSLFHIDESFSNDISYSHYRITFPETRKMNENILQFAEIELPGLLLPSHFSESPTTSPTEIQVSSYPSIAPSSSRTSPVDFLPVNTVLDSDSILAFVGSTQTGIPYRAIDGTTQVITIKNDKFQVLDPGFTAVPSWAYSVVTGIRVYPANNKRSRDPASYIVEGRRSDDDTWLLISQGDIDISRYRNPKGVAINSSPSEPDPDLRCKEISFANNNVYAQYRVMFPTTKGNENSVHFAEVELPGYLVKEGPVTSQTPSANPTPHPSTGSTDSPTKFIGQVPTIYPTKLPITEVPTTKLINSPIQGPTEITGAPTSKVTATPPVTVTGTPVNNVLDPGTLIEYVGAKNSASYPSNVVDGTTYKFGIEGISNSLVRPGLIAIPSSPSIAKGIRFYVANNYKERDPNDYILEGRKSGDDPWDLISQGDLSFSRYRNPKGIVIQSTPTEPDHNLIHKEIWFSNNVVYSEYKITFPTGDWIALSEVELPGVVVFGTTS